MGIRRDPIDRLLVARGIDPGRISEARATAEKAGVDLIEGMARTEGLDGSVLARALADAVGLPFLPTVDIDAIDVNLVRPLPLAMAREQGVLPLWDRDGAVEVAIASPRSIHALDDLRVLFGRPVRPFLVAPEVLRESTNRAFDKAARNATAVIEEIEGERAEHALAARQRCERSRRRGGSTHRGMTVGIMSRVARNARPVTASPDPHWRSRLHPGCGR
jgi:hypothetical protein